MNWSACCRASGRCATPATRSRRPRRAPLCPPPAKAGPRSAPTPAGWSRSRLDGNERCAFRGRVLKTSGGAKAPPLFSFGRAPGRRFEGLQEGAEYRRRALQAGAAAADIDLRQPEIGDQLGMAGEQFQKQLELLQLQDAVLAEHLGLRRLARRLLLKIEALGVTFRLAAILGQQRDLHRGLRGDDVALLVGGGARLLGLLALFLRRLFLDIGGAQLTGELFALTGQQQFGRDRRFAEANLLDVDAGAAAVDLRAIENRLFQDRAILDGVEDTGRARHIDERAFVVGLLHGDRSAIDIAHQRADRGHENALIDFILAANRRHYDRRVLRR